MTVPVHLASSHKYTYNLAVADATALIALVIADCVTNGNPAWTNLGGNVIKSPVDSYGRFYTVGMTATSGTQLTLVVTDQYGTVIDTRCIDLNGAPGNDCVIYSGQYHLWIDSMRATPENFRSGILDCTPQAQNVWNTAVYCLAMRNSANTVTSNETNYLSISGVTAANTLILTLAAVSNTSYAQQTPAGDYIFWPVWVINTALTPYRTMGRMYQVLVGPGNLAIGTLVNVPIDTGVLAKFRVCGTSSTSYQMASYKFLVRAD